MIMTAEQANQIKEKYRQYHRDYYKKNSEKLLQQQRDRYKNNPEKYRKHLRDWRER